LRKSKLSFRSISPDGVWPPGRGVPPRFFPKRGGRPFLKVVVLDVTIENAEKQGFLAVEVMVEGGFLHLAGFAMSAMLVLL